MKVIQGFGEAGTGQTQRFGCLQAVCVALFHRRLHMGVAVNNWVPLVASTFSRQRCGTGWLVIWLGAFLLAGCREKPTLSNAQAVPSAQPTALHVLVVDEPRLAERLQELWQTRGEGELTITPVELSQALTTDQVWTGADVAVFPRELFGDLLAEGRIVPFAERTLEQPEFRWREVADALRRRAVVWDRRVFAVPMGAAIPLLWYRADVYKHHGWAPPSTWLDYARQLERLPEDGSSQGRSVEPLAAGWAGRTLLMRASAYALHPSYLAVLFHPDTMEASIDGPPFVQALEELIQTVDPASLDLGPRQTVAWAQEHGHVLAIGEWPQTETLPSDWYVLWDVAQLPAADQVFDRNNQRWEERPEASQPAIFISYNGLLAAVTRQARNQRAASNYLALVSGPDWGSHMASASARTAPWRSNQLQQLDVWFGEREDPALRSRYAQQVLEALNCTRVLVFPAIRGEQQYIAALDEQVRRAVRRETTAQEALREAARQWNALTERYGKDAQKEAYRKSIGL